MKKVLFLFLDTVLILYFIGCATAIGKKFNYQSRTELTLGKTTNDESVGLFEKPYESKTISNKDGNFEIMHYIFAEQSFGGALAVRTLLLEFREGILNAHIYNSGFSEDATEFNFDASENIKIGISTKEDVSNIMGDPSGRALCPSYLLEGFSKKCEEGKEIWIWNYKGLDNKFKRVWVTFDENGLVKDVEREIET